MIRTVQDEKTLVLRGLEDALAHRLNPERTLDDNARRFAALSFIELGREFLQRVHGVNTRGMDRMTIATQMLTVRAGLHMGSEFTSLLANVANKRLREVYDESAGSYRRWAKRAPDLADLKPVTVGQLSAMPDLLLVTEHGEFKYGSISDQGETYAATTYGRIVGLTRQIIVNDDVRAFDRALTGFGGSAARLENRLVYAQLTANANMADGNPLFGAAHANNDTGAGSALQATALATGRTRVRVQKGLQGEELNLAPAFLIVPAALEQTAYQLTSANYVPATQSAISEFRTGGRTSLEPVVEPVLDSAVGGVTAWYLACNSRQCDTVEYAFVQGADAPHVEAQIGFETDGVKFKCRHDFAAKAIDWRGLYRGVGV
jgi:hypothetical protein